jgi:hypothetical protein
MLSASAIPLLRLRIADPIAQLPPVIAAPYEGEKLQVRGFARCRSVFWWCMAGFQTCCLNM